MSLPDPSQLPPGSIVCVLRGPDESGMIPPGRVPTALNVSVEGAGDDGWVILQVSTPVGFSAYHFQRNTAVELANLLKRAVGEIPQVEVAKPGLFVPGR
jgi:hypothetical protein